MKRLNYQKHYFSIRKMTIGLASISIGFLIYSGGHDANASEINTPDTNSSQHTSETHVEGTKSDGNHYQTQTTQPTTNASEMSENVSQAVNSAPKNDKVTERDETIPYQTRERQNPNMPQGMRAATQKGINGQVHVTIRQPDNHQPPRVIRVVTRQKQDEIIDVGTGIKSMTTTTRDRAIPFDTVTRQNNDLPQGTHRIVRDGRNGLARTTIAQDTLNGRPLGQPSVTTKTLKAPTNRIIEVGRNTIGEDIKIKDTRIPYRTIEVKNPQLHKGMYNVVQVGQYGYRRTITTQRILNNHYYGEPMIQKSQIQSPIAEIVEVGLKEDDMTPSTSHQSMPTQSHGRHHSYQNTAQNIVTQPSHQTYQPHSNGVQTHFVPVATNDKVASQQISPQAEQTSTLQTLPETGQHSNATLWWGGSFGLIGMILFTRRFTQTEQ